MIIKQQDDRSEDLIELSRLLALPHLSDTQAFLIKREIANIKAGIRGEKDSAYYLDFYFKNTDNSMLIHDLRIEIEERVAQIDHLLITRFLEFYVLESKNFYNGIKINENGEFSSYYQKKTYGIPSPIEQNQRHIEVLRSLFEKFDILPKRLGVTLPPKYINYVLMSPNSVIQRPSKRHFKSDCVIKADVFKKKLDEELESLTPSISDFAAIAKVVSKSTLKEIARKLVKLHQPQQINWKKRFNIDSEISVINVESEVVNSSSIISTTDYFCANCKKGITVKAANYCWNNKKRFGGRAYCFQCQQSFS